jgi:hypothetical protein
MAEARQKEIKVNITVVATKTLMAGFEPSTDVAMLQRNASLQQYECKLLEDNTGEERAVRASDQAGQGVSASSGVGVAGRMSSRPTCCHPS